MAAYAALVSLMNDLELIQKHPRHSFSFENKQIASLSQTVHFLIDFMESYDSHGCSREAVDVLESRIAFAAHAAHDVVESHLVDQIHAGTTLDGKARSHFLPDLQKAIDDMGLVKREAMQFEARCGIKAEQITYSPPTSSKPLTSEKNCMVGFDAVLVRLMEMLTGEPSSLLVIPIEGMGGIGKTTLAKNAYDHLLIQHHFDVRCWATISQEYSAKSILMELLLSIGERNSNGGNVNELGDQLHKKLWGRRYLIILDDMWSEDAWDEVQMFLPDNDNGSRVIVTTRLSNLATYLSPSPFKMNCLDEDESWKLFCGKAFEEEECPAELEGSGRRIVGRCGGLPLSIAVIGGHLRKSSRAIEYWEMVAGFMNPVSSLDEDEKCMNVVSLSYHQLPVCLKPCFLYFGVFQEDEFIDVRRLLRLWVSEGFVKAKEGLSLEEVAEDYLEDLIDRNLVIVCRRRWNGKAETCGIHDIVRELCLKVGKKEKFVCVLDTTQALLRERRIAIPSGKHNSGIDNALESAPLLRSLLRPSSFGNSEIKLSVELRLLRVSDCVEANICSPEADIQRVNLRYFASCYVGVREILSRPWSILSLCWNLQTINMSNYYIHISAPQAIWEMAQLRHLEFTQLPNPLPVYQQERIILRNLQTLVGVKDFRLTEEVCKRMPNIKELSLKYLSEACSDCYPGNLGGFNKLESLSLDWCDSVQSFTFPSSLQELSLVCYSVDWEDIGMIMKSLPHLGFLKLRKVKGEEWRLADEEELEFPCLKSLHIWDCDDLIYWNANSSNFPVLETLEINFLPKLIEIPIDMGDIPTLARIDVIDSSVSAAVSAMRIVVEQQITCGNQDLQLHVSFNTMEEVEIFQKLVEEDDLKTNSLRLSCRDQKFKALLRERRIAVPSGKHNSDIDNALESAPLLFPLLRPIRLQLLEPIQLQLLRPIQFANLPWSISLCWNLQTINMSHSLFAITPPQEIWEVAHLRHLKFNNLYLPNPLPDDQQECIILQNLQTLVGVKDFRLTEEVCKRMPNIKELSLSYVSEACSDCYPGNLGGFNKLESLSLNGCDSVQSFTFPSSLQELRLYSSSVDWEDIGMIMKSLPHLGFLELSGVEGEEWTLADEEEFPCLKYLRIEKCGDLIYWNANSPNFPVLETLEIKWLPKLSEIPIDMGNIPTLARIELYRCSVSAAVSAMRIVVEQQITCGNQDLQLHIEFKKLEEVERFEKLVQQHHLKTNSLRLSCGDLKFKAF